MISSVSLQRCMHNETDLLPFKVQLSIRYLTAAPNRPYHFPLGYSLRPNWKRLAQNCRHLQSLTHKRRDKKTKKQIGEKRNLSFSIFLFFLFLTTDCPCRLFLWRKCNKYLCCFHGRHGEIRMMIREKERGRALGTLLCRVMLTSEGNVSIPSLYSFDGKSENPPQRPQSRTINTCR